MFIIKHLIDGLKQAEDTLREASDEWDRVDHAGTLTEKQRRLANEMVQLRKDIEGFRKLLESLSKRKKK